MGKINTPYISKSKYLNGLQCNKLLWYYYNAKDEIPAFSKSTQAIFDQGHQVGEYAKKLFPGGIEVANGAHDIPTVVKETQSLLSARKPLFEPGFTFKDAYARADILKPVGKDKWNIYEVKSSTQVKDVNLFDLALQWYTYFGAGLKIDKCFLIYINNRYVRKGPINVHELFIEEDVTKDVKGLLPEVEGNLEVMSKVIQQEKVPDIPIGPYCNDPYDCVLKEKCWSYLPKHNPTTLYRFNSKFAFSFIEKKVVENRDLRGKVVLSDKQQIQIESIESGQPHIDKENIVRFLDQLSYPLFYLDFESIGPAIPLYDNSKPFEQIPFQFSLHIQKSPKGETKHISFLAVGTNDPRPELLRLLKEHLGTKGSIVAYNASFEQDKLKKACEVNQEFKIWNAEIQKRFVDLLLPFRSFSYYHPDQLGSASIKRVLPVLTGKSYSGMEISEGGTASNEFIRVTFNREIADEEKNTVRKNLEEYCKLDTQGMVWIVDKLYDLVSISLPFRKMFPPTQYLSTILDGIKDNEELKDYIKEQSYLVSSTHKNIRAWELFEEICQKDRRRVHGMSSDDNRIPMIAYMRETYGDPPAENELTPHEEGATTSSNFPIISKNIDSEIGHNESVFDKNDSNNLSQKIIQKIVVAPIKYTEDNYREVDALLPKMNKKNAFDKVCKEHNFNREGFEKQYYKKWYNKKVTGDSLQKGEQ